ncbi:CGNR zinc finger domain-containing protein [Arthrobacter sp. H41]|uniref:CGNR zinc finger domain-containing protein n=1 Tax=Arthrobacter sp. H41 TaxID=1312978 RepID=UPI00047D42CD|nr:CGNR zinc finger domain-containing protein [Arthrobacter sp. H41]
MHFAYDTEDVLEFGVALANTDPAASTSGEDELTTQQQLAALIADHRFSGRIDGDDQELAAMVGVRQEFRRIWALDRDSMVSEVNALLESGEVLPRLARHDGLDWHLHAAAPDAPLATRIRLEMALALVDVIRAAETERLRVCDADDCSGLLLDLSRNRSKRFCSVRCANRVNMVAYRRRQSADA